ncbi:MAG TPA: divalent metal cation transporter [Vicinamibacterales bacterium]|jgi:Mn2+/Fe2+ NRAMP family transporter|nr:divalent metal cation transporter [Vicinamibacterales bacterium]
MKTLKKAALGILTSVGSYLEVGSMGTALQAGAAFRFELLWAIALGTICIAFLLEMSGRLSAVSGETVIGAMREDFGFSFQVWPLATQILIDLLVLASEIGGASLALELATGISIRVWAIPVAFLVWAVLWKGTFGSIESGVAILGMVTLSFVLAAWWLHPDWREVARGFIPRRPMKDGAQYAYLAVGIIGATVSPYLVSFYSSGAIEDRWKTSDLTPNKMTAAFGMGFGSMINMAVLVVAAMVLAPRGIVADTYQQAGVALSQPLGRWGFWLFCASLFIGSVGAALEVALDVSYITAQTFGWKWGESQEPAEEARFALTYIVAIVLGIIPSILGIDPLKFTMFSMSMTVLALPIMIAPLIVIMNDRRRLKAYTNGLVTNVAVVAIVLLSFVLALLAIPVQVLGG